MPYPPDDEKVTVARLYQMKINWYYAGLEFHRRYTGTQRVLDPGALTGLRDECEQGILDCTPHLGDNQILLKAQWENHYPSHPKERPMEMGLIHRAIAAFGGVRWTQKRRPTQVQDQVLDGLADAAVDAFKDCYIRFLNNGSARAPRPWQPIVKDFDVQGMTLRSQQVPVNVHFPFGQQFVAYGETGLCSNTPRLSLGDRTAEENLRVTNFWYTALSLPLGDGTYMDLFSGFRSGSLAGKVIGEAPQGVDVAALARSSVEELLHAVSAVDAQRQADLLRVKNEICDRVEVLAPLWRRMALVPTKTILGRVTKWTEKQRAGLREIQDAMQSARDNRRNLIFVVSINLQTTRAGEGRMIRGQSSAMEELDWDEEPLDGGNGAEDEDERFAIGNDVFRLLSFNCEVNNLGGGHPIEKRNSMRLWGRFLGIARAYLDAGLPGTRPIEREYTAMAIGGLLEKFDNASEGDLVNPARDYKTASRLAVLAHLCRCHVHFNCKSGKDRTGLMDIECKRLAASLLKSFIASNGQSVTVPRYALQNDRERDIYQEMLARAGNFEVQEYNTGGRGFKVAQTSKVIGTPLGELSVGLPSDAALTDRFGGGEGLAFVKALTPYMDVDPLK